MTQLVTRYGPGLGVVAVGTLAATGAHRLVPSVSVLVASVIFGALVGNIGFAADYTNPGLVLAASRLLRLGIVLVGLRLSVGRIAQLGSLSLIVAIVTVLATFFGTQWMGRRLGLSPDLSLLVGTGYAICGVSAIAAVEGSTDAQQEDVAVAIGLVTLAGSMAIFVLPILADLQGLGDEAFGAWAGASVHDVAQVIATVSTRGDTAMATAIVVKLTRVVLLAPIVAGVNIRRRHSARALGHGCRPPLIPLFVAGFLGMVALRSVEVLPPAWISAARMLDGILLSAALVGIGAAVRIDRLRRLGIKPLMLGSLAWVLVGAVSLAGVYLTT